MSTYEQLVRYDGRALTALIGLLALQGLLRVATFPFAVVAVVLDKLASGPLDRAIAAVPRTSVTLREVRIASDRVRETAGASA